MPTSSNASTSNIEPSAKRVKTAEEENSLTKLAFISSPSVYVPSVLAADLGQPASSSSSLIHSLHINLLNTSQQRPAESCPANKWMQYEGVMVKLRSDPDRLSPKGVIAFDMDGTIIATKSGKTFAVDESDWKFWDNEVPRKLQSLYIEGFSLAFLSNQGGVGKKKDVSAIAALQRKVDAIIDRVGVPIDFICSFNDDIYRKPRTGMWDFLSVARWKQSLEAFKVTDRDFLQMYVGDAAGRPAQGTRKKDFSDSDLKLAINLGVQVRRCLSSISTFLLQIFLYIFAV
jgi:DNA 3'-phosphatase